MTTDERVDLVVDRIEQVLPDSVSRYRGAIRSFVEWRDPEDPFDVTPLDVEDYLLHLTHEKDYAYQTVSVHQAAIGKFFEQADRLVDGGRLDAKVPRQNPLDDVNLADVTTTSRTKKEIALEGSDDRHGLDEEVVEDVADSVQSPKVRNELMVRLTYQGMLRRNELVNLTLDDLDRDDRSITIRSDVSKTGEPRTTFYAPSLDRLLDLWIEVDREAYPMAADSEHVFLSNEAKSLSRFHAGDIIREAAERSGHQDVLYIDASGNEKHKITTHSLRHSGAVRRWSNGADLRTLQKLLGHQDISTTEQYLDVGDEDLGEKARQFW